MGIALLPLSAAPPEQEDYKSQLPRIPAVEPFQALETFMVKPPLRIELVAAEPLVQDPVALAFDADARLYVVQMCGYSEQRQQRLGSVRLLEDRDGDGRYETSILFAQGLYWPTAVACWDGGVFVADPPDIWYMKDTDGDGRADLKRHVFTGFGYRNVQAMVNTFRWGLDNRIHGATSRNGARVQRVEGGRAVGKPLVLRGRDFAFDPRTLRLEPTSGGGQHGMGFDDWGHKFVCDNSHHIQQVMYEDRYFARAPHVVAPPPRIDIAQDGPQADVFRISPVEPWRVLRTRLRLQGKLMQFRLEGGGRPAGYFTSATGITIYRGDDWPEELRGLAIVADVGSNIIHRKRLEPRGVEFLARRIDSHSEMVASRDIWFRPVQFANGPDGCLYVADMYREVIEHPESLGPMIKPHLDLTSGRDRGRIYRICTEPRKRDASRPMRLSRLGTEQLVALLAHPNAWHRETAARLLYQRQDRRAVEPLREMLRHGRSPLGRLHALYALQGLGALRAEDLLKVLDDPHPQLRRHGVRLCEQFAGQPPVERKLLALSDDPELEVCYQLAFTLGELQTPRRFAVLAHLARRYPEDRWLRAAVLSSLEPGVEKVFVLLWNDPAFCKKEAARVWFAQLAALAARRNQQGELQSILAQLETPQRETLVLAVVRGLVQGLGRRHLLLRQALQPEAQLPGTGPLRQVIRRARQMALDEQLGLEERIDALEIAAAASLEELRPVLEELLNGRQPSRLGQAALRVLGQYRHADVPRIILEHWPEFSPPLRQQAVELLLQRRKRIGPLLDAIEQGVLNPGDLSPAQIQRLCLHRDETLRRRAMRLLSPARPGKRAEVVAAYRRALALPGDANRGRKVFRKICAACHRAEGVGHELGPNLAAFKHRGAEAILVNVLDPNREVNPQYVTYSVLTTDGRVLTGMITAETATSITLTREEGKQQTILRSQIEQLRSNNLSLMPEGLEKQISVQEMADLIAYLMSLS